MDTVLIPHAYLLAGEASPTNSLALGAQTQPSTVNIHWIALKAVIVDQDNQAIS